jgi:putative transposase
MDNLGSHKRTAVVRVFRRVGARLFFLPKYSPDPNPIEQLFAKLKHSLRTEAKRSVETTCDAIGHILNRVRPTECSDYFTNSGYDRN